MRGAAARVCHARADGGRPPLLAGALRLGFVANFISEPVLTGFKAGIGIVIVVDQIRSSWGSISPRARSSATCSRS